MKILRKNNKTKCKHCNSKISYEPNEVKEKVRHYDGAGFNNYISYLQCPVCKGYIQLAEDDI